MSKPRNLVVGIRSFAGSRTALVAAAEELLAASPVLPRAGGASYSSAYLDSKESPKEFVAAGFAFKSAVPATQLLGLIRAVEERLGDPTRPGKRETIQIELLWVAGEKISTPQLTLPSPRLSRDRWAIASLVEAGETQIVESMNEGDEDRATGKKFSHYFDTIPGEPRWSGSIKDYADPVFHRTPAGLELRTKAVDLADAFAVAGDYMALADIDFARQQRPGAKPEDDADAAELAFRALRDVVPEDVIPVETAVKPDAPEEARVSAWTFAVRTALAAAGGAPLSRTVVFEVAPSKIRGAILVGKRTSAPVTFQRSLGKITFARKETPIMKWIEVTVVTENVRRLKKR